MVFRGMLLVTFALLLGCSRPTPPKIVTFEFAVYKDQPIFVDTYLYDKVSKQTQIVAVGDLQLYLVDWNGKTYAVVKKDDVFSADIVQFQSDVSLNLVDQYFPVELIDGELLQPEFKKDTTVIYFWATWCGPCIKTLKNIGPNIEKLNAQGIDFIPVAYKCSDSKEFLTKNNLPFEDHIVTEKSAKYYNIQNLSKQYTFLADGQISEKNVDLKQFYDKQPKRITNLQLLQ